MPATPPSPSALDRFLDACAAALPEADVRKSYRTRCIGWNMETSTAICDYVVAGEKTGTFSLPWLHDSLPETKPEIGQFIVLTNFDGEPRALLKTMALTLVTFKDIDETHTALDGPSVRDLTVWRGIHTTYWNGLLSEIGRQVEDDMPVVVERFTCVYPPR